MLGLSAYLGWVQSDFATSAWHIEPFVTGTSYWIKSDETSFNDLRVKSDNLHQSVVRLGATVGYRANRYPITWTAKAAWAHRFGQSVAVTGFADRQSAALATDDLKESWGELSVEGRWSNERGLSISARAQVAKSNDIKPKLEVGLQAKLRF